MSPGTQVVSTKGVVAAEPIQAAEIGAKILADGGNAMDAASATALACCMMRPAMTGVAGYICSALVLDGNTGRVWSVDANAVAPAAAREDMFEVLPPADGKTLNEREYFCRVKDNANEHGPLAIAVPGMMAGMGIVWERWGRLKWADVVAPSQALIEQGFPFGPTANSVKHLAHVIRRYEHTALHLMPDGEVPKPDDVWHRPGMERTLDRVAKSGWRDFYDGELGREIADYVQTMGGTLSRDDMAAYEPRVTAPYEISFRGTSVYGPILPNGCLSSLQILNMVDCFDPLPDSEPAYWHRYAEILKLAWRDRLRYAADPDFADVPVERLLSKDYAWGRTEGLRQCPDRVDNDHPPFLADRHHGTTHLSTADAWGNVVSMTISQGMAFGSCFAIPNSGLICGHGMCRLDPRPGRANSIAPGKRPLNNTATMLFRSAERDVGLGLPGGRKIICVMPRIAQSMIEFGRSGLQAAYAPRMHVEALEPLLVQDTVAAAVVDALKQMGHEVETVASVAGRAHIAEVLKGDAVQLRGAGEAAAGAETVV